MPLCGHFRDLPAFAERNGRRVLSRHSPPVAAHTCSAFLLEHRRPSQTSEEDVAVPFSCRQQPVNEPVRNEPKDSILPTLMSRLIALAAVFPPLAVPRDRRIDLRPALVVRAILLSVVAGCSLLGSPGAAAQTSQPQWYSAWAAPQGMRLDTPDMSGTTARMIVRPTIGGNSVRVKIENTLGEAPVVFSTVYFGQVMNGADLIPGSNRQLMFAGGTRLDLAPGEGVWSDPLDYSVVAFAQYAVSLGVASAGDISAHTLGLVTNFMADGMRAAQTSGDGFSAVPDRNPGTPVGANFPFYWVADLDVRAADKSGAIVAFGDSITDGRCSTKEEHGSSSGAVAPDLYQRWTDLLAERLASAGQVMAVANEGIAGNRVVTDTPTSGLSALTRMDRDVLERAGTTHIIFFEGTNDVLAGSDAATVIAGTQQVIERAHAAGLKIIGVTMIPRGSATGWTAEMEQQRLAVNAWIRTEANFDGIIDFAKLLGGPTVPSNGAEEILPAYSCYDGTHPNDLGYAAMSGAIDLSLFAGGTGR